MKTKLVALFAIAFMTASCDFELNTTKAKKKLNMQEYKIVIIDDCEYIFQYYDMNYLFSHKGNCKNPIHICE